jgi:iron complex outermembrane receptor protein
LPADRIDVASNLYYLERRTSYQGVDASAEARFTPTSSFNVIAGVETVYDREELANPERIDAATGERVGGGQSRRPPIDLVNIGTYLSSSFKVFDPWLKLSGGLRYDHHADSARPARPFDNSGEHYDGDQLTGRIGATSRWTKSLVAKLLYGTAFKAPTPYLSHAVPLNLGDVIGNPHLQPQVIRTLEYQMSLKPNRFFGITSGISYSWLLQKAEFTPQGINQTARNVASQRSASWETRADLSHYHDYTAYASLELVRSFRDLGQRGYQADLIGTDNVAYPPYIGRAGLTFAVPSVPSVPLNLGAEGMLVGARRAADNSIVERGESFRLPSYFMLDVSLATRELYLAPGHETRMALRSRNLLVTRGPDPGFAGFEYPLAPAELFLEIEHTY